VTALHAGRIKLLLIDIEQFLSTCFSASRVKLFARV